MRARPCVLSAALLACAAAAASVRAVVCAGDGLFSSSSACIMFMSQVCSGSAAHKVFDEMSEKVRGQRVVRPGASATFEGQDLYIPAVDALT